MKLAQNWERFRNLLLSTENRPIVEESRRDAFWGAKPVDAETLSGANVLGHLLMDLREQLRGPDANALHVVPPPSVPDFLLYGKVIGVIAQTDLDDVRKPPQELHKSFSQNQLTFDFGPSISPNTSHST